MENFSTENFKNVPRIFLNAPKILKMHEEFLKCIRNFFNAARISGMGQQFLNLKLQTLDPAMNPPLEANALLYVPIKISISEEWIFDIPTIPRQLDPIIPTP